MKNGIWLLKSSMFNRFFSKLTHILLGSIRCNLQKKWIHPKNVTYVSMATKIPIIKYREFLHISMCYISANNEDIASKFTPVMQGNKWRIQKIKWPWNVKVKVKHIKNHENHLLSHNFGTGSGRNFWLVGKHSLQNSASGSDLQILTYDVTFLRHVTLNKMNNFEKNVFLQIVKVKGQT